MTKDERRCGNHDCGENCTHGESVRCGHDGVCGNRQCELDAAEARGAAREREACEKIARDEQAAWAALRDDRKYPKPAWNKAKSSFDRRARTAEMIADAIAARGTRGEPGGEDVTK